MPSLFSTLIATVSLFAFSSAHTVITYPGWRGDNLISNGTLDAAGTIPNGAMGINYNTSDGSYNYPYGMQWMYPCGGMGTSRNRTKWPVKGGAIAIQPGWFQGHAQALFYINMGLGNEPLNMSHVMVPMFQITGPANTMYKGEFCLPQVPLPTGLNVQVGDNATIQVIETAQHGAALYNCVDITFAEPADVEKVTEENCHNSTEPEKKIGFNYVYATSNLDSAAISLNIKSYSAIVSSIAALAITSIWI